MGFTNYFDYDRKKLIDFLKRKAIWGNASKPIH